METDFAFDTEHKTIKGCIKGLSRQIKAQFVTVVACCNGAPAAVCSQDGASDGLNIGSREHSARRSVAKCKSTVRSLGPNNNRGKIVVIFLKIVHLKYLINYLCLEIRKHKRVTF